MNGGGSATLPANVVSSSAQLSNGGGVAFSNTNDVTFNEVTASLYRLYNGTIASPETASIIFYSNTPSVASGIPNGGPNIGFISGRTGSIYGASSIAIGHKAMLSASLSGGGQIANIAIGNNAMGNTTGGGNNATFNVALGADTLTRIGNSSGATFASSYNIAIGNTSLRDLDAGKRNTGVGFGSLQKLTSGSNNTVIGGGGSNILTGSNNVIIGTAAMGTATSSSNNVALGDWAGAYETGSNLLFIDSLNRGNPTNNKANSIIWGTFADAASDQTLTFNAGRIRLSGSLSVGASSLNTHIITGSVAISGSLTVASNGITGSLFGSSSYAITASYAMNGGGGGGAAWTTSSVDVQISGLTVGIGAGSLATNTVFGVAALGINTTGDGNTAIGYQTLFSNDAGAANTAVGYQALYTSNIYGGVAVGAFAGKYEINNNAFYINNQDRFDTVGDKSGSLFYGTFNPTPADQTLRINANTTIAGNLIADAGITGSLLGTASYSTIANDLTAVAKSTVLGLFIAYPNRMI